jgi:hypothetical protein
MRSRSLGEPGRTQAHCLLTSQLTHQFDVEGIGDRWLPAKRTIKHVRLFKQGELGRLILDTFREAGGAPLSCPEITAAVMRKAGFDPDVRQTVKDRVRLNLNYMMTMGRVRKIGTRKETRRSLA